MVVEHIVLTLVTLQCDLHSTVMAASANTVLSPHICILITLHANVFLGHPWPQMPIDHPTGILELSQSLPLTLYVYIEVSKYW